MRAGVSLWLAQVWWTPRGAKELAGAARDDGVADLEGQLAFEDVEELVEVVVMQRRAGEVWSDAVVHHRDAARAVVAAHEHVDAAWHRRQRSRLAMAMC